MPRFSLHWRIGPTFVSQRRRLSSLRAMASSHEPARNHLMPLNLHCRYCNPGRYMTLRFPEEIAWHHITHRDNDGRHHTFCLHAGCAQSNEIFSIVFIRVIVSEPISGYKYHIRFAELGLRILASWHNLLYGILGN